MTIKREMIMMRRCSNPKRRKRKVRMMKRNKKRNKRSTGMRCHSTETRMSSKTLKKSPKKRAKKMRKLRAMKNPWLMRAMRTKMRKTVKVKRREVTHSTIKISILKHQMMKRMKMKGTRGM